MGHAMTLLTPEQVTLVVGGAISVVLLLLTGFGLWVKAKFAALATNATKNAESDTIKSRALALKEMMEVESAKFVFKTAEQSMITAQRVLELERKQWEYEREKQESAKREEDYKIRLESLTAEVLQVRQENANLQRQIVVLETENASYRLKYGVTSNGS